MRIASLSAAGIGLAMLLAQGIAVEAAEIKVLNLNPLKSTLDELGAQFERTTGHKLLVKYDFSAVLKRQIDGGETFDVAILLVAHTDDLLKQGKIAAGTRTDIARLGIGVAVRKGAPKPDIQSVDAFKRTLLNATSITHAAEGASGLYFTALLERLGIAAETKSKLRPTPGGATMVVPVAKGEAEMAVCPISTILAEPGVEFVGPLPPELQNYSVYTAGVGSATKHVEAAKALIEFLTSPAAISVLNSKGLEPVTP